MNPLVALEPSSMGSTSHSDTIREKIGDAAAGMSEVASGASALNTSTCGGVESRVRDEKNAAVFVGLGVPKWCRGAGFLAADSLLSD
jgi:hypothetical protein